MNWIKFALIGLGFLAIFASCGQSSRPSEQPQIMADSAQAKDPKQRNKPLPPMSVEELLETPIMEGRVATSADVRSGLAHFSFNPEEGSLVHQFLALPMPFFAYRKSDRFMDTVLVIYQAERLGDDTLMAWRNGWNERGQNYIQDLLVGTTGEPFQASDFSGYRESHEEKLVKELERRGS